jgi:hypothetical protein
MQVAAHEPTTSYQRAHKPYIMDNWINAEQERLLSERRLGKIDVETR